MSAVDLRAESLRLAQLADGSYGAIEHRNGADAVSEAVEALMIATEAQVLATVYLADQQRIANLQFERGLLWKRSERVVGKSMEAAWAQADALDLQIREGLGLS